MQKTPAKTIIKNIYLYLVTFIGLLMLVIPGVQLLRMGFETALLPPELIDRFEVSPPRPFMLSERVVNDETQVVLNESDLSLFEDWKVDYEQWREREEERNRPSIQRRRDIANNAAAMIGGLILFLTHRSIIRKDRKKA